jgi:hypothetical protein
MKKAFPFLVTCIALITMVLASTGCTKKVAGNPVAVEDLTVIIGSVTTTGDTTVYLQTVVKPVNK